MPGDVNGPGDGGGALWAKGDMWRKGPWAGMSSPVRRAPAESKNPDMRTQDRNGRTCQSWKV